MCYNNIVDLASRKNIKSLLRKYQIRPSKKFGQNFLIDKGAIKKIINAADLKSGDVVLEIGPGIGVLTQELVKRVKRVVAVEKDQKMIEILEKTMGSFENVKIIHGDILKIENWKLEIGNSFKAVGNLPFYLTAPVIRQLLENAGVEPRQITLVVQKEVAQRICARSPRMNLLAVSVQFYAEPKIIAYISQKSFWPSPEVDAAIIKISNLKSQISKINRDLFFRIVKAGFSQPRKQLINNLSKSLKIDKKKVKEWLKDNGIQPTQRAETLSLNDWVKLAKSCK
jgi:16S rRNA (adenine1518-N6/adenine1519-N6)-dimethyltransferase